MHAKSQDAGSDLIGLGVIFCIPNKLPVAFGPHFEDQGARGQVGIQSWGRLSPCSHHAQAQELYTYQIGTSGGGYYYYPHLTDEKMSTERLTNLPKVTQLKSDRARI